MRTPPLFTAAAGLQPVIPDPHARGVFLLVVALLALWGQYVLGPRQAVGRLLSALPQQFVLVLSTAAALTSVGLQSYPDHTLRPWYFILLDQLPLMLGAALYCVAVIWPAVVLAWEARSET